MITYETQKKIGTIILDTVKELEDEKTVLSNTKFTTIAEHKKIEKHIEYLDENIVGLESLREHIYRFK